MTTDFRRSPLTGEPLFDNSDDFRNALYAEVMRDPELRAERERLARQCHRLNPERRGVGDLGWLELACKVGLLIELEAHKEHPERSEP